MTNEEWQEIIKNRKQLRELDIFISTYLFNKPCVKWWWTNNYDGEETVANFKKHWEEDENSKEPLFELIEGDYDYHNFSKKDKNDKTLFDEEDFDGQFHRWNLKVIPYYSRDLNLIHRCEEKIKELKLENRYLEELFNLIFQSPMDVCLHFNCINANAQTKAKALVKTLKDHFNVE